MMQRITAAEQIGWILTCLMLLAGDSAIAQNTGTTTPPGVRLRATHILGFENISNNASGELSIQGDDLRFQKTGGAVAQISVLSIQDVSLGEQDKQVGGTAMAVGKAAVPFGGGRVIGLFAHKHYDIVTLQYLDPNGGSHGAIFQLDKGQAQVLKDALDAEHAGRHTEESIGDPTQQGDRQ
jgi:hypothetical protein